MDTLSALVASMPSGNAFVRLTRSGVTYVGGPYATVNLACESAGRLFCDVPDVTSIAIVPWPEMTAPSRDQRWYARAILRVDGYTAVAGPFRSPRRARSALMALADRGQIGAWHEWAIDYHEIADAAPLWRPRGMRGRARWHSASTPVRPGPPTSSSTSMSTHAGRTPARWTHNAEWIARWITRGGYPDAPREDLLRDIVMLWDEWPADSAAWDALATVLATIAAADGRAAGLAGALLELAAAIEDRAATAGAEDDVRRLVRALVDSPRAID